jgi:hypothetical protein
MLDGIGAGKANPCIEEGASEIDAWQLTDMVGKRSLSPPFYVKTIMFTKTGSGRT